MTKIIGLTGGIGSGKSTIANYIASKGIPVYIADEEAKKLMQLPEVIACLISCGFIDDKIMRAVFAPTPFTDNSNKNSTRSSSSAKPYKVWLSSFTTKCVNTRPLSNFER